jgi:hypothetical protein
MDELAERDATGDVAVIYAEIRRFWAVPYVSSMQRHLATRPGWLEWVWAALRPAFAGGLAQTAGWRAADGLAVPRLPPIARDALRVWGVDAAGETAIRATCDSFIRASPTNLVLSGLLRRILAGERPSGRIVVDRPWTPPPSVPSLPAMVDLAAVPPAERGVLLSLSTPVDGQPFVPGLYRMLGQWPGFIAHVATVLQPHLHDPETRASCQRLLDAVDAEIPAVFAALPPLPSSPSTPSSAEFGGVLAALDAYRKTSPEMVVFSRLIRDALPAPGSVELGARTAGALKVSQRQVDRILREEPGILDG